MFDDPLRAAVKKVGGIIGAAGQKGSKKLSAPLLYDAHCCHIWVGAPFAFHRALASADACMCKVPVSMNDQTSAVGPVSTDPTVAAVGTAAGRQRRPV